METKDELRKNTAEQKTFETDKAVEKETRKDKQQSEKNEETAAIHAIDKPKKKATLYHDTQRVPRRANEVSDRNDTGSGGLGAGGGNSASQY